MKKLAVLLLFVPSVAFTQTLVVTENGSSVAVQWQPPDGIRDVSFSWNVDIEPTDEFPGGCRWSCGSYVGPVVIESQATFEHVTLGPTFVTAMCGKVSPPTPIPTPEPPTPEPPTPTPEPPTPEPPTPEPPTPEPPTPEPPTPTPAMPLLFSCLMAMILAAMNWIWRRSV